jgi:hypothetical protein
MKLRYRNPRWHPILGEIDVELTDTGWTITPSGPLPGGACNPRGEPALFSTLDHDGVNYPAALGGYMEHLWKEASDGSIDGDAIQSALSALGEWITAVDTSAPKGVWEGYK